MSGRVWVIWSYNELMVLWRSIKMEDHYNFSQSFSGSLGSITWVSCHSDRPMWRYATLCVLSNMYRKLLFNNSSIVWNIRILLIAFCQESQQMLCAKFLVSRWNCLGGVWKVILWHFAKKSSRNGCGLITRFGTIQWILDKVYVSYKPKRTFLDYSTT